VYFAFTYFEQFDETTAKILELTVNLDFGHGFLQTCLDRSLPCWMVD